MTPFLIFLDTDAGPERPFRCLDFDNLLLKTPVDFCDNALLSQQFVVAIYPLFPPILLDLKTVLAFRMYWCGALNEDETVDDEMEEKDEQRIQKHESSSWLELQYDEDDEEGDIVEDNDFEDQGPGCH